MLGSLCAARLREGGHDVALLAQGERLGWLRAHGVVISDALTGKRTTVTVELVDCLKPRDAYDLVLVLMGRHQVPDILQVLKANTAAPTILFMGNNVNGADPMGAALGISRVLLGFYMAAGSIRDGVVVYGDERDGRRRACPIGEPDGTLTARLESVAEAFERAGVPVEKCPNIVAWLRTHAATILPMAGAYHRASGDLRWLPSFALVPMLRRAARGPAAEIGLAHAGKAREEMRFLAADFSALIASSGLRMPALTRLLSAI